MPHCLIVCWAQNKLYKIKPNIAKCKALYYTDLYIGAMSGINYTLFKNVVKVEVPYLGGETEVLGETPPQCHTANPTDLTWDRIRTPGRKPVIKNYSHVFARRLAVINRLDFYIVSRSAPFLEGSKRWWKLR